MCVCLFGILLLLQKNCLNTRSELYKIFQWKQSKAKQTRCRRKCTGDDSAKPLQCIIHMYSLTDSDFVFVIFYFALDSFSVLYSDSFFRPFLLFVPLLRHSFWLVSVLVWFGFWMAFVFFSLSSTRFLMVLMCIIAVHTVRCDTI